MGGKKTVFAARTGNDAVVSTIITTVAITEINQLTLPFLPVDHLLIFGYSTGVTNALIVETNSLLRRTLYMSKLNRRNRTLIVNGTLCTKHNLFWKAIHCGQVCR